MTTRLQITFTLELSTEEVADLKRADADNYFPLLSRMWDQGRPNSPPLSDCAWEKVCEAVGREIPPPAADDSE